MDNSEKDFVVNIEGVEQNVVAGKISEVGLFILQKIGSKQNINDFAKELQEKIETTFTPEEKTYLTMMYCAGNIMRVLKETPLGAAYGIKPETFTPPASTSKDEDA